MPPPGASHAPCGHLPPPVADQTTGSHLVQDQGNDEGRSKRSIYHTIFHQQHKLQAVGANAPFVVQWMVLVVDDQSKKLIDNTVKEDDILNNNIASTFDAG